MAPDARRVGLQPAGSDRPRQRRRPPHGLDPRPARGEQPGDAPRVRGRALHAEPRRRHPGARRRHRRPALGVPAGPSRRSRGARHLGALPDQPQHRHPRPVHHRHQRRRLRVRPRRRDRPPGLGDGDPRLPDPAGAPVVGSHRGRREDLLRAGLHAGVGTERLRRHCPRRGHRGGAVAPAPDSRAGRAGRRNLGRPAVRGAPPRRRLDGAELRRRAQPGLLRDLGHVAGPEVLPRRDREHAPLPQLDPGARRRHRRDPLVLPAPQRSLGPRPPVRAHPRRYRRRARPGRGHLDQPPAPARRGAPWS